MNRITTLVILMMATPVSAGGYVAPITSAPPVARPTQNWTGPYVGVSYGTQRTKSTRAIYEDRTVVETRPFNKRDLHNLLKEQGCKPGQKFNLTNGEHSYQASCQSVLNNTPDDGWATFEVEGFDPITVNEWTETTPVGVENYRTSESTVGAYLGYRHQFHNRVVTGIEVNTDKQVMAQAGYSLGRVLPYATVGYDFDNNDPIYGAGVDVAISPRVISGVSYTQDANNEHQQINARLGWRF